MKAVVLTRDINDCQGGMRGRPTGESSELSTQAILDKAKILMEKAPSIRNLASNLNVDAMAIYLYFNNKNAPLGINHHVVMICDTTKETR